MRFMDTKAKLNEEVKAAMRAGDDLKRTTLRMVMAAIKNAEIDARAELDEGQVLAIVQKEIKSRRESIEDARAAGREDLIATAEAEMAILEKYLPEQLGADEIRALVEAAVAETGATSPRDMGAVMKVLMPRVQGQADGKQVSAVVRDVLQG